MQAHSHPRARQDARNALICVSFELLEAAYENAMERACENELKSVGFCILSANWDRGGCPLKVVIETGLKAIAKNTYSGLETIVFCGFTPQEQAELHDLAASLA